MLHFFALPVAALPRSEKAWTQPSRSCQFLFSRQTSQETKSWPCDSHLRGKPILGNPGHSDQASAKDSLRRAALGDHGMLWLDFDGNDLNRWNRPETPKARPGQGSGSAFWVPAWQSGRWCIHADSPSNFPKCIVFCCCTLLHAAGDSRSEV